MDDCDEVLCSESGWLSGATAAMHGGGVMTTGIPELCRRYAPELMHCWYGI